jgi:hypothetical protein
MDYEIVYTLLLASISSKLMPLMLDEVSGVAAAS